MAFVHGKNTFISLDGKDLSTFANASELNRKSDKHDVTTFGKNTHVYQGGLGDGTSSISGVYDNTAVTGPRAVIRPLVGTTVTLVRRPEGTGAGRPQDTVPVFVEEYVETNPVADMVTWSVTLQLSGDIVAVAQ